MFGSSLPPVVCRTALVLFTLCSGRLYLQLFVGRLLSYLRYVRFVFISSCLQEGSCLIYVMFASSLSPVVCRRALVLFKLYSFRLYLQLFVGGLLSYLRYVRVVVTSSCLQKGSSLIYVMFGSSLPPVVCRRTLVLFTLCSLRLYLQLFVGGLMSYLRYVRFVFISSCLQEGSCLIYVMFASSLSPVVCRSALVLFTLCSLRLYLRLFVGRLMSYLRYVRVVFISSCLQDGSCLIYVMFTSSLSPVVCRTHLSYLRYVHFVFISSCLQEGSCLIYVMFALSLSPVVYRRAHVLVTLCSVRLYLQLFVGRLQSYLRYVRFVFTSSCLQDGSCLIYVMYTSSLSPVVCRSAHVLFTLCSLRLYLQFFVGGLLSYLRYVRFVFISSCLQEGSCLIYVMFASSLSPVVCRRSLVLFTLCSLRLYLQLFVGRLLSYLRYVRFVFISSCLQERSCLIYVKFTSSLPPVVCRSALVLFTLCSLRFYLQLFVGGLLSYLRYVRVVFTSSCLQEGSCLIDVMFGSSLSPVVCRRVQVLFTLCSGRLYLQLFVGLLQSYLRYVRVVFTSSCLQDGSCLIYVMFASSLSPVVCRRAHVLFTLCSLRLYLQLFVGGLLSYLRYVRFVFISSCLQEGSCLIYVMFGSSLPPVVCRRALVLFTLCSVRLYLQLFVGRLQSYLRYVRFVFTSSCLQDGSCLIYVMLLRLYLQLFVGVLMSYLRYVRFVFISSFLQEGSCLIYVMFASFYLQLFVGGLLSYLRYVRVVFTSSCLQEGSCLIYVMFASSSSPVVCRSTHVLFTLCSLRLYLQSFAGGLLSYLLYVRFVFISSCLQDGSCLIYVMFASSLSPVVCRSALVLFTLSSLRLYLQLFVGRLMSYLRYVRVVFISSCLQDGSCLIYVKFTSSLSPVVCRKAHVLFTLCSGRLYFQLFVGRLLSYLRYVHFVFISSCLQDGSCLIYVMFISSFSPVVCRRAHVLFSLCSSRLYLQLFVGVLLSYLLYVRFVFISSCLQEASCLIYVMFGSSLPPVVCRRAHVLLTLCSGRLYLQLFVGGFKSYLRYVRVVFTSSCLQDGSCLIYVMFASSLSPVVCRRAHILFTLCSLRLYPQLFVGALLSYLRYVRFVFISSCLQEGS